MYTRCFGLGRVLDPAGEDQIPKVALKGREIEGAELAPQPGESPSEVGRMIDQIRHDAAGGRAFEPGLRLRPLSPMSTQDGLLSLDSRTVERIGLGECQLERSLMIAGQPGVSDELAGIADRAEPLIVEIVGEAVARQRRDLGRRRGDVGLGHVAEDELETIAAEMLRAIGMCQPPHGLELEVGCGDGLGGTVGDGQILDA